MQAQEVVPQQDAATCAMALGENGHMVPLIETQTQREMRIDIQKALKGVNHGA